MLNEINDLAGELQAAISFSDPDRNSGAFLTPLDTESGVSFSGSLIQPNFSELRKIFWPVDSYFSYLFKILHNFNFIFLVGLVVKLDEFIFFFSSRRFLC